VDSNTETLRTSYIWRNNFWLPTGIGNHLYIHFNNAAQSAYCAEHWFYHNSLSGGARGIEASSHAYSEGGLTNCFWLNNIFNDVVYWFTEDSAAATTPVGIFDYNLITPPFHTYPNTNNYSLYGTHNIRQGSDEWVNTEGMSFELIAGSAAIGSAVDLGDDYVFLPYYGVQIGGTWDMGANEYQTPVTSTPRPGRSKGKPRL